VDLIRKQSLVPPPKPNEIKVVFTPLHGVGAMTAMEILVAQGFRVIPVEEQMRPDGQFPNVTQTPNPEAPASMDRAAVLGKQQQADVVLATDPDADRVGAMIPDRDGSWRFVHGNDIAALLTHFKLARLAALGQMPASPIIISTAVTTGQITRIGRAFGCQVVDNLLVGFKFHAEVLRALDQDGRYEDVTGTPDDFVIAVEESHGAMVTPRIRDKDAGGAALLMAELTLDQKRQGRTVLDYLERLAKEFGYFRTEGVPLVMTGIMGKTNMLRMMDGLRKSPPTEIAGLKVTGFEDLRDENGRMGPFKGETDKAARNFLVFRLGDQARVMLRPSGTEPKAKIYVEASSVPMAAGTSAAAWKKTCDDIDALAPRLVEDFKRKALAFIDQK
jgi:phosphoglucomutase/phosphomannomutase